MKNTLKTALAGVLALALLVGCGFALTASAESGAQTSAADTASPVSRRDASGDYDAQTAVTLSPEDDLTITEAGTYILSGRYDGMILIEAGEEDKVQLVLENAVITNENGPAIYVRSADKVFLTAAEGTVNTISDGAAYALTDGETTPDAAVFSKEDLTINGAGALTIRGNYKHAVVSKDDLVVTAKALTVEAEKTGLSGKDSVTLAGASVSVTAGSDGVRSDVSVSVLDGTYTIRSGDDGIRADETAEIAGGTLDITAVEGIEATRVLISGGDITIRASDDGVNAVRKSSACQPLVEISGGTLSITMGAGDTDGIDTNGDLVISGGTVIVNGTSAFDYDGSASFTGGTVIVNGQELTTLPNQFMGGMGGFGGGQGGFGGGQGGFPGGQGRRP